MSLTGSTTVPRYAQRRGTRGFAAFVTLLAGFVVLAVGLVVLPSTSLDSDALTWLVPLTVAFGLGHLVAAYGLIRRRDWSRNLVGYLAAIGIGVAAYGLLLALTGLDPIGATSTLPAARAWADGLGLMIWLIGLVAGGGAVRLQGHHAGTPSRPAVAPPRRGGHAPSDPTRSSKPPAGASRPRSRRSSCPGRPAGLSSGRGHRDPQPVRARRRRAVLRGPRRALLRRRGRRPLLRPIYPEADLAPATRRLTMFLVQYWGGPTTYDAERGHPRLRMRHAPFAIGPAERDRWLVHMRAAMADLAPRTTSRRELEHYFTMAAEAMRNRG